MTVLLDTHWVISGLNGRPDAVVFLASLEPEGLAISEATYGEVYDGIYYGRDPASAEPVFREFLRRVTVLPVDQAIWRRFAQIRGHLRREGQPIGDMDVLIAATALEHGLTLVTRNRRHFERIPSLSLYA